MAGRIYSVGYEGTTLEELVEQLTAAHVSVVIDVRLNAISRKPGFSRRRLAEGLAAAGIDYVHEKELGNPRENRESFRRGDGADGRARMRSILEHQGRGAVERVVSFAASRRVALLCVEREHERCHRSVIAELAVELDPSIEVVELRAGTST